MPVSNTVTQFRQNVLNRRGPQIAAKYKVIIKSPASTATLYPLSIILPGRNFSFYDHDIWGPIRRVPFKRGYTQCNMSFIIYQDWGERLFLEQWMNEMVIHKNAVSGGSPKFADTSLDTIENISQQFQEGIENVSLSDVINRLDNQNGTATSGLNFDDWIAYGQKRFEGSIEIICLDSKDNNSSNITFKLFEVYPAQITPVALGSDGTGYPSFTVSFQFNDYEVTGR